MHAHPDDETLTTGGTIAHYAARGADVHVVTCTLGEEGEVIGPRWAGLVVSEGDQLGGYRIGELTAALAHLGVASPVFLGGAGRWRDSGMAGTPARHRQRFVDAPLDEAAATLAALVDDLRPHVVVTYDADGGYGHPDHVRAHQVTMAAVDAAAWAVPKVYWTVTSHRALDAGLRDLDDADLPPHWTRHAVQEFPFRYADEDLDAVVDVSASRDAKLAAMRAHATQISVSPDGRAFALSNDVAQPVLDRECYVLAAGSPGDRDVRGWETDLLAGLNLG